MHIQQNIAKNIKEFKKKEGREPDTIFVHGDLGDFLFGLQQEINGSLKTLPQKMFGIEINYMSTNDDECNIHVCKEEDVMRIVSSYLDKESE